MPLEDPVRVSSRRMEERSAARLLTPAFVALTASDLAYFSAGGLLLSLTPLFAVGPLGTDVAGVGVVMGAFGLTTLLLRPWAGRTADRRGRRRLLVGGALGFFVAALGHLLVATTLQLLAVRTLMGAAEAAYVVAGFAALADLAPPGRAGEALSLNSLALYVGLGTGPVLGQLLLVLGGFDLVWTGAAVLAGVATVLALRVPETRPDPVGRPASSWVHRRAVLPGFALLTGVAVTSGFLAFAVLRARAVDLEAWSLVLLGFGASVVLLRVVLATLPDKVPPLRLAALALVLAVVGLLVVGASGTPSGLLLGAVVLGAAAAFLTPAVFAAVFSGAAPGERGSAAATTSVFLDLGLGGGPAVLGLLATVTSLSTAFLVVTVLPGLGVVALAIGGAARPHPLRTVP